DDRALGHVGEAVQGDLRLRELLGDDGERRARGAADAEGEVARAPAHDGHEEPAFRGRGVLHQVADEVLAEVAGRREPKGVNVARQREVVVDRLRHVRDGEAGQRAGGPRPDRRRRDHRVDPGGRAPADEDGECLHGLIVPATRKWSWPSGVRTTSSPSAGWTPVRAPMLSWWVTSTKVPVAGRPEM